MEHRIPLALMLALSLPLAVPTQAADGQGAAPPTPAASTPAAQTPVAPAASAPASGSPPAAGAAPAADAPPSPAQAADEGRVCRTVKVTGSRVRKERICTTRSSQQNSREWLRDHQDRGANEGSAAIVNGG